MFDVSRFTRSKSNERGLVTPIRVFDRGGVRPKSWAEKGAPSPRFLVFRRAKRLVEARGAARQPSPSRPSIKSKCHAQL